MSVNIDKTSFVAAWTPETSSDPSGWSPDNRAWGQCAVTALVVQDRFGGVLLRTVNEGASHYWNRLPNGDEVDLTRDQFKTWDPGEIVERDRSYVLSFPDTVARYERLKAALSS